MACRRRLNVLLAMLYLSWLCLAMLPLGCSAEHQRIQEIQESPTPFAKGESVAAGDALAWHGDADFDADASSPAEDTEWSEPHNAYAEQYATIDDAPLNGDDADRSDEERNSLLGASRQQLQVCECSCMCVHVSICVCAWVLSVYAQTQHPLSSESAHTWSTRLGHIYVSIGICIYIYIYI